MADTYMRMTYVTELSDKDMKIISLGLIGRLKRPDDIKAAKELHMRLLKAQSIRINEHKALIDGAIRKAMEEDEAGLALKKALEEEEAEQNDAAYSQ